MSSRVETGRQVPCIAFIAMVFNSVLIGFYLSIVGECGKVYPEVNRLKILFNVSDQNTTKSACFFGLVVYQESQSYQVEIVTIMTPKLPHYY